MPYPWFEKKCRGIKFLLYIPVLFISVSLIAQVKWTGGGGDGEWANAANWVGNQLPATSDDVILDNSVQPGNYTVLLPGAAIAITIKSIVILPAAGNNIQL